MKRILIPALNDTTINYENACKAMDFEPVVSDSFTSAEGFDALLLPGGADINPARYGEENKGSIGICDERDCLQIAALEGFLDLGKPIFGTCRGHQLINVYFGGSLKQDIPGHRIENEGLHAVNIYEDTPYYEALGKRIMVNSTHHQCIDRLGKGLVPFAVTDDGIIEGVYNPACKILAVQWHPERIMDLGGRKIYELFKSMIM